MRETGKECGRQERSKEKRRGVRETGEVWGGRIKSYMNEGVKMYYSKG